MARDRFYIYIYMCVCVCVCVSVVCVCMNVVFNIFNHKEMPKEMQHEPAVHTSHAYKEKGPPGVHQAIINKEISSIFFVLNLIL